MKNQKLTQERVRELFDYDPETGSFRWRNGRQGTRKNLKAGTINSNGYVFICIDYKNYSAHRLAWLYIHGYLPENQIDHINRQKIDNRICNLREVSSQCNTRNTGNRIDNKSGVKGICFDESRGNWIVYIEVNQKRTYLGRINDFDESVCLRLCAEQCLGWSGCDSNSPAYQYVKKNIQRR